MWQQFEVDIYLWRCSYAHFHMIEYEFQIRRHKNSCEIKGWGGFEISLRKFIKNSINFGISLMIWKILDIVQEPNYLLNLPFIILCFVEIFKKYRPGTTLCFVQLLMKKSHFLLFIQELINERMEACFGAYPCR